MLKPKKNNSFRVAQIGVLTALAIVMSLIENLLPPIAVLPPGAKLGLSNIVIMFAAESSGFAGAICIALLKGGFTFLTRGVTAGVMSLSGGLFSTIVMCVLCKKTKSSWLLIGVSGALAHNTAQLLVAYLMTATSVIYYIPFLLLFGIISGSATGISFQVILRPLRKIPDLFDSAKDE